MILYLTRRYIILVFKFLYLQSKYFFSNYHLFLWLSYINVKFFSPSSGRIAVFLFSILNNSKWQKINCILFYYVKVKLFHFDADNYNFNLILSHWHVQFNHFIEKLYFQILKCIFSIKSMKNITDTGFIIT